MDIREVFARNLRKARNARRLSQEALAHEAGVDRTYVSALERGVYNATIVMVAKLAKALDVEPSELLRGGTRLTSRKRKSSK
ncbi:MAG: helix-turn-helix transcriptional regulator [Xanthobacteraceae bacterium]